MRICAPIIVATCISSATGSEVKSTRGSEEGILLIVVSFETMEEGEEDGVWNVTGEMSEVEVREGFGIYCTDRLMRVRSGKEDGESLHVRRWDLSTLGCIVYV